MSDVSGNVRHIVEQIEAGTDADWAHEWHETNCHLWDADGEETLEDHLDWCSERPSAYDYLADALSIEYIVSSDRQYLGAEVLVAWGGPTVIINTRRNRVEGYWWADEYSMQYEDNLGLDEVLEDLWNSL